MKEIKLYQLVEIAQEALFSRAEQAQPEAETLVRYFLENFLGKAVSRVDLYLDDKIELPKGYWEIFKDLIERRKQGIPLQHITGEQVFLNNTYRVSPDVLIPRPETEALVYFAKHWLMEHHIEAKFGLEIGLGSGAISLELLSSFSNLIMTASEWSDEAVEVALENARRIKDELGNPVIRRLKIVRPQTRKDVWSCFSKTEKADFLISNPPYLHRTDPIDQEVLNFEPVEALFPPENNPGFFYEKIATHAKDYLNDNAVLFLEISEFRSLEIANLFENASWKIEIHPDLNERDRILVARNG